MNQGGVEVMAEKDVLTLKLGSRNTAVVRLLATELNTTDGDIVGMALSLFFSLYKEVYEQEAKIQLEYKRGRDTYTRELAFKKTVHKKDKV